MGGVEGRKEDGTLGNYVVTCLVCVFTKSKSTPIHIYF